jgi:hypothetical protein
MAKKSSAARNSSAARRSQTTTKPQKATLVRATESGESVAAVSAPTKSAPAPKPESRAVTTSKPAPVAKPAARTAPATKPTGGREQAARMARARATQRARAANLIIPENYKYVIHDLRLTGILAALMFAVIVVLHFVLG